MSADRRPAAAARGHRAARPRARRNRSARTSCSISTSPAASRAPPARSRASTVIEIGPGPGGLTRALLAAGARRVDRDRARRALPRRAGGDRRALSRPARQSIAGDALDFDPRRISPAARRAIVANLPYNIATALLVGWLTAEPWPPWYDRLMLMFQREVAERIVAAPGLEDLWPPVACSPAGAREARILFDVAPRAFVPPPKVTSSLVELDAARRARCACDRGALRARDRGRLRPAPQDAAPEPRSRWRGPLAPARSGRHRADRARRGDCRSSSSSRWRAR